MWERPVFPLQAGAFDRRSIYLHEQTKDLSFDTQMMGYVDIVSAKKMIKSFPFEHNFSREDVYREIGHYRGENQGWRAECESIGEENQGRLVGAEVLICLALNIGFTMPFSVGQIFLSAIPFQCHLRWLESPLVGNLEPNKSDVSAEKLDGTPPLWKRKNEKTN